MSNPQIPPWLQEQIMKFQQSQQNLQHILMQKQELQRQTSESKHALEELEKASDTDTVYKRAGSIMIKSKKSILISDLGEIQELAKTKSAVLEKQETQLKTSLQEQETKINEMITKTQSQPGTTNLNPPK
ncbi:MAG: prefoldin subunit beta [Candidatus Nitrosoabyssus spongiisocia]|nr:MAG: prefoldin subunit beta [Nitrosopumilaceae archaeon AB1(1)]